MNGWPPSLIGFAIGTVAFVEVLVDALSGNRSHLAGTRIRPLLVDCLRRPRFRVGDQDFDIDWVDVGEDRISPARRLWDSVPIFGLNNPITGKFAIIDRRLNDRQ